MEIDGNIENKTVIENIVTPEEVKVMKNNAVIQKDAEVKNDAVIQKDAEVKNNAVIQKDAEVKNDAVIQKDNAVSKENIADNISLTEIEAKIVKQLEFYFSNTNLPYDKFLLGETKADNGWVKISVLSTFKRLASISKDPAVIAASIKKTLDSILEVDEANEKIRRKLDNAIPVADQSFLNELIERSIYCKGFPKAATMDDLLNFASTFGDKIITKVTPRRLKTKEFKGSLYFTFNSKEEAEKFLNLESVRYNDVELERMWEKDFISEKKREYENKMTRRAEKIKAETEKYFKKGYLIKADNVDGYVTVDDIKTVCSGFNWQVAFVKIVDEQKLAWIRLKPIKSAKDLLEEIADKKNDLDISFSIPDEETEQTVLNEMTKEMKGVLNMKEKHKKDKNKFRGGKNWNYKRKLEDGVQGNKKLKTMHTS